MEDISFDLSKKKGCSKIYYISNNCRSCTMSTKATYIILHILLRHPAYLHANLELFYTSSVNTFFELRTWHDLQFTV